MTNEQIFSSFFVDGKSFQRIVNTGVDERILRVFLTRLFRK